MPPEDLGAGRFSTPILFDGKYRGSGFDYQEVVAIMERDGRSQGDFGQAAIKKTGCGGQKSLGIGNQNRWCTYMFGVVVWGSTI